MTHFKKPSLYKDVPYTATNSSTMSNGEVKRWYVYSSEDGALYAVSKNQRGFVPDASTIEVMPVEDHERIVAEKDAEIARLIQEVANRNQYKLNQEALDNVHKVYEEQLAEARQLISSLLSGVEFYSSGEFPWSSDSEHDNGSFADYILEQNKDVLKNFGKTI